jgi:hypothetical protein
MSGFFNTITSAFTSITSNTKEEFKKNQYTLRQFIKSTDKHFTEVIKLLINSYLANDKFLAFQLLDATSCMDSALYLSETFQKQLSTIDFKDTEVLYEKKKYKCDTYNSCEQLIKNIKFQTKTGKITNKKEICDNIATFHIRIMNLISVLLVQLDPSSNIAIQRMNILYKSINNKELEVSLCSKDEQTFIDSYGLNELMNLYLYNLLLSIDNTTEVNILVNEYNNLINILKANLEVEINPIIVKDIKYATSNIKAGLTKFHKKFRVIQKTNTPIKLSTQDKEPILIPNNETNTETSIITKKELKEQEEKINEKEITIEEQQKKLTEQTSIINKQRSNISELEEELRRITEELDSSKKANTEELTKLKEKIKEVSKKYTDLMTKKKAENNAEVAELKDEILTLIEKIKKEQQSKKTKLTIIGGELNDTANRFKEFMKKFNVSSSIEETQNKFFKLFTSKLKIPETVKNICSRNLDNSRIIKINFSDNNKGINKYLQIYNDMSNYYINKVRDMIRILEDEILEIEYNDSKEVIKVNIRKLNESNLKEKETKIRLIITEYINQIHTYYLLGINELNTFLTNNSN